MIRDRDIPEHGLKNTEVFGYLKDLGHPDIQQSSVTEGLLYLPRLLKKNRLPSIFDYDGMYFYLLDNYMKFVLKWAPELIDDLFEYDGDSEFVIDSDYVPFALGEMKLDISKIRLDIDSIVDSYLYNEFVSLLSQMKITYEDKITKTAEIQHPVFGKNYVTENDTELIKIIEQLKIRDIDVSMDNDTLFGFDFGIIIFYLGFLFAKEHISCHPISMRSVTISLTEKAKRILKIP